MQKHRYAVVFSPFYTLLWNEQLFVNYEVLYLIYYVNLMNCVNVIGKTTAQERFQLLI